MIFWIVISGTIVILCLIAAVRWELGSADRINDQMAALRDRARANPPDKEALDSLIHLAQSNDSFERTEAIAYLGQVGSRAEPAVDLLIKALKGDDYDNARVAATSLGEIGPGARRAIPALIEAVERQPDDIGAIAANSLGEIAKPSDTKVVAVLKQAAKSPEEDMRLSAQEGLDELGIK